MERQRGRGISRGGNLRRDGSAGERTARAAEPGAGSQPGGLILRPGYFDRAAQAALLDAIGAVIAAAPWFVPRMPRTGTPFSVRMSNCGPLGWVSDIAGYRYQPTHPDTGQAWPAIPELLLAMWKDFAGEAPPPQACLVNGYAAGARMGLHQDKDEEDFTAPIVSMSLGDTCVFRIGGTARRAPTQSVRLASGDALVLGGDMRLAFHGVDRILAGSSTLLADRPWAAGFARINLTLRRVHRRA